MERKYTDLRGKTYIAFSTFISILGGLIENNDLYTSFYHNLQYVLCNAVQCHNGSRILKQKFAI